MLWSHLTNPIEEFDNLPGGAGINIDPAYMNETSKQIYQSIR